MAYNHGREDRKWRIWKEAEEKLLRECGVDEATIEQIRIADRADFNSNRRFYRWTNDIAEYLEDMADRERQTEVGTVAELLDEIESENLYQVLVAVDGRTLKIVLLKMQGYSTKEIAPLVHLTTVAVRKYHCIFCVSSPASRYTCFPARCWSLGCPGGDNLTRIASWRTHRMARRKRNVSDLPYAAPPLSCAAFFVKVQNGFAAASAAERKRGREKASRRCGLFLCLKGEDSHHQFCLQPFPNVVVYAKIDVPALVVQLPHGEAGYVAAEMLQDNLHSVRVALCRCQNDRIGNKGFSG